MVRGFGAPPVSGSAGVLIDLAPYNGGAFGSNGTLAGTVTLTPDQLGSRVVPDRDEQAGRLGAQPPVGRHHQLGRGERLAPVDPVDPVDPPRAAGDQA